MTNQQHPIEPSPELVDKFWMLPLSEEERIAAAYRAGADAALWACCELLDINGCPSKWIDMLRDAMRTKPPSLAEQALALISHDPENQPFLSEEGIATIRAALERLQQLELENND